MGAGFEYFVLFAEMRTGSNFLEANLNALDGVSCLGEAFNPHFIGYPNRDDLLGVTQAERDSDPMRFLGIIRTNPGEMTGFRYFHDHDPRILDQVLDDRRCAKIILTRNPADSYVSWKIARQTGQWKLTDVKRRKAAKAQFDPAEFEAHVSGLQDFQVRLLNHLQRTGQTAFYVAYEDLQDLDVMNGLASFLGVEARLDGLDTSLKVQNPASLASKVANYSEMQAFLAEADRFNLTRTPNFEPRRGAVVPSYVAGSSAPLLYLPLKGGPEDAVLDWMGQVDGAGRDGLLTGFSQKELRKWKRERPGHRSFTVVRHPVARAHHVFCTKILSTGEGSYPKIRRSLSRKHGLNLPDDPADGYSVAQHKAAFLGFLDFLKGNLNAQTAIRVDASWCTQSQALQGIGNFALPDRIVREQDMAVELGELAGLVGVTNHVPQGAAQDKPFSLAEIYDDEIEKKTRDVYQRDYVMFGFDRWSAPA